MAPADLRRRRINRLLAAERELDRTLGTKLERKFDVLWIQYSRGMGANLPSPIGQHVFAAPRRYRFDRAWPLVKVAVELEGGIYMSLQGGKSRHTYPPGFEEDLRKYNLAASKGWLVFRLTSKVMEETDQIALIEAAVLGRLKTLSLTVDALTQEQQKGLATDG